MLERLRAPGIRRLAAALMVAATASLSFPFVLFAPAPLSADGSCRGEGQGVGQGQSNNETYTAASRALAAYDYDPAGRILEVKHWWQVWNDTQQTYADTPVKGSAAAYATYLGLKTGTSFLSHNGSGGWTTDRTEYYTYDANTDWLTSVDYNDGLSNEVTSWTYDAAGNRASDSSASGSWTYDNLNRMSASPYGTYTNDLLGNRTDMSTSGSDPKYRWDLLNRMTGYWPDSPYNTSDMVDYVYRADGMRVTKADTWVSPSETTKFYYDGQMGVQDTWTDGTDTTVTKYGLGARGIDVITKKVNSGSEQFGYPLYDTHGNMVATLARSGSNSYSTGNAQSYDVWGGVRSGSSTEDQGYVANLGHRRDSESSLTYMRARYYEPSTGRFISQDSLLSGNNWYSYAGNNPINKIDVTGQSESWDTVKAWAGALGWILAGVVKMILGALTGAVGATVALSGMGFLLLWARTSGPLYEEDEAGYAFYSMMFMAVAGAVALLLADLMTPGDEELRAWFHFAGALVAHVGFLEAFMGLTSLEEIIS